MVPSERPESARHPYSRLVEFFNHRMGNLAPMLDVYWDSKFSPHSVPFDPQVLGEVFSSLVTEWRTFDSQVDELNAPEFFTALMVSYMNHRAREVSDDTLFPDRMRIFLKYLSKDIMQVATLLDAGVPSEKLPMEALMRSIRFSVDSALSDSQHQLHDRLTGLLTKKAFHRAQVRILDGALRGDKNVAQLYIDIDKFKTINDLYGHVVGDHVLEKVGAVILSTLRTLDAAGRVGGEELAALVLVKDLSEARLVAERLRSNVQEVAERGEFDVEGLSLKDVRVSVGVAMADTNGSRGLAKNPQGARDWIAEQARLLSERSDLAMAWAKLKKGRNAVASIDEVDQDELVRLQRVADDRRNRA